MSKKIRDNVYFLSIVKKGNTILFGLLATVFLNRALGPALKGEYSSIYNIISTVAAILNLGISSVYPNYVRKKESWTFSTFFGLVFFQGLLYTAISVAAGLMLGSFAYMLYGLCIMSAIFSTQVLQMSIVNDFKKGTIANIVSVVTNALMLFIMWFTHTSNVLVAFGVYFIKEMTIVVSVIPIVIKKFHWKDIQMDKWAGIVKTGLLPMLTDLMMILNYKLDVIILEMLRVDYYQIGLYSVGLSLAEYGWVISDVFKDVLIKKTASSDDVTAVSFCLRVSSTALLLVGAMLLIGGKLILTLLYGASYEESWLVTDVVFLGVFSMSYVKLLMPLYRANGRWLFYFLTLAGAVVINVGTNFCLIPIWGIYGAAITSIMAYTFAGLTFVLDFCKCYAVPYRAVILINSTDISQLKQVAGKLIKKRR